MRAWCCAQAHLWSSRKQLTVLVGALQGAESHVSVSPFALQANQIEARPPPFAPIAML